MKKSPHFNGPEYQTEQDHVRLKYQHDRVKHVMKDGEWRTLDEIAQLTQDPLASISAQLRHLRKKRFGSWVVERRARGDRSNGLFEYRLLPSIEEASDPTKIKKLGKRQLEERVRVLEEENARLKSQLKKWGRPKKGSGPDEDQESLL